MRHASSLFPLTWALFFAGCGAGSVGPVRPGSDGGPPPDTQISTRDDGASPEDGGGLPQADGGALDGSPPDAGQRDGGQHDAGQHDAGQPTGSPYPIFTAPTNIWTTPLGSNAPIDPQSAAIVSNLVTQFNFKDDSSVAWYSGEWYTFVGTDWQRIWDVIPAGTTTKRVLWIGGDDNPVDPDSQSMGGAQPLQSWIDAVPVPDLPIDTLRSQGGGDKPLVLYQEATDTLWEFWLFDNANISGGTYHAPDGTSTRADYTCHYAGRIQPVSQSLGVYPYNQGSSATSLPYADGMIMIRDSLAGSIEHALTMVLPVTGPHVAPATRDDSQSNTKVNRQEDQVSEGTLFRLPPSFDPAAHAPGTDNRSVFLRMVLTALRDYGVYISDSGPCLTLVAEGSAVAEANTAYYDLTSSQVPSWWGAEGIFWGANNIMLSIPWDQMQVVAPRAARNW